MKHTMYSIYDTASGLYSHPVYEQSDKAAIRSFSNIATAADSNVGLHPEDYSLFRLGLFNDTDGRLHNEKNECLCTALECVAKSKTVDSTELNLLEIQAETNRLNGENLNSPGGTI